MTKSVKNVLSLATAIFLGGLVLHSLISGELEHKDKSIRTGEFAFTHDTFIEIGVLVGCKHPSLVEAEKACEE